jgi:ketosteroid isomerase-like protein
MAAHKENEAAIAELIDGLVKAIRAKDIGAVMSVYAPDLVAFDIIPPLQFVGSQAFTQVWQHVFDNFDPIHYEVRDLRIAAGEDIAFSHSLNEFRGTLKNGRQIGFWLRWTAGLRKVHGKWLIAHLQASVPADVEQSGKAVLDLQP